MIEATQTAEIKADTPPNCTGILSDSACGFLVKLANAFESRRKEILAERRARQCEIDAGAMPDFLRQTREIRSAKWVVAPIPHDLQDRRVEITGPVDRKMIINGLNSGASVFMADFEDANSPTWRNNIEGQMNLRDAVNGSIEYESPEGKKYELAQKTATLMVRPRGWHLDEKHFHVAGKPVSASLFDFGIFFFHNAKNLIARGTAPYFYLPKMQSHREARLWNDVFIFAQNELGIPRGTIRATVLIETIHAAFEMDEILYELREHISGLNCGRWDYIFSFIKAFRSRVEFVLPDRAQVTMTQPFLDAYVRLLIQTCHHRGAHAMGGMAAQIPNKADAEANRIALDKVREDKLREVRAGHDGTWVAHPGLVSLARQAFDENMNGPNQIRVHADDRETIAAAELVAVPNGQITERGLRHNIDVGIRYIGSWLSGNGCVPIYGLMEDAATAEICRAQVWQWRRHGAKLADGRTVSETLVKHILKEEGEKIRKEMGPERFEQGRFAKGAEIFQNLIESAELPEFLTAAAYELLD
jgi:malate synthase